MADKTPRKPGGKKPGKTLKEKRTAKKLKRRSGSGPFETADQGRQCRLAGFAGLMQQFEQFVAHVLDADDGADL